MAFNTLKEIVKSMPVRRVMYGLFVGSLLFSPVGRAGEGSGQDALSVTTAKRDTLKADVKDSDVKLDGARKKLQDLIRSQAPLTDVQVQKERIRHVQKEKLKLLTRLLEVEEKRAELLMKLQEARLAVEPVKTKVVEAPVPTNKEILGAVKQRVDKASVIVSPEKDFGSPKYTGIGSAAPTIVGSLGEFKKQLAKLKTARQLLKSEVDGLTAQAASSRADVEALGAAGDPEKKKKLTMAIAGYTARKELAVQKLSAVNAEFYKLQKQFEVFVGKQVREDYIMPGQKLELTVVEDKSFNGKYIVKPGGYILLPRIGRVGLAGKSREDAEMVVKKSLESTQLRIATVLLEPATLDDPAEERREMELELLKAKTKYYSGEKSDIGQDVIYLTGAFKRQGPWVIPKGFQPTLLTTLIRSGWVLDAADLSNVRVLRMVAGKSVTETIDIQAMMAGKPNILDIKLSPADVIIVPDAPKKQKQTVYLTGNVKTPGALTLTFEKPVTAYMAILNAGGFTRFANLSKVFILRDTGKEKKERIPVDMKKVKQGEIADPELKANDIIVVPESFWGTGN